MSKSLEHGDELLADAFAEKSDRLAGERQAALASSDAVKNLTARIDSLQELFGEETPNGKRAQASDAMQKLMAIRAEATSGKSLTNEELHKLKKRFQSLEAQLLPPENSSAN